MPLHQSNFYIQVEYSAKEQVVSTSLIPARTLKAGVYTDNYAWDEYLRKLFIGNSFFDDVMKLTITNGAGDITVNFEAEQTLVMVA